MITALSKDTPTFQRYCFSIVAILEVSCLVLGILGSLKIGKSTTYMAFGFGGLFVTLMTDVAVGCKKRRKDFASEFEKYEMGYFKSRLGLDLRLKVREGYVHIPIHQNASFSYLLKQGQGAFYLLNPLDISHLNHRSIGFVHHDGQQIITLAATTFEDARTYEFLEGFLNGEKVFCKCKGEEVMILTLSGPHKMRIVPKAIVSPLPFVKDPPSLALDA